METYKIIRMYRSGRKTETIRRGMTLDQAQAWCSREDTHKVKKNGEVVWFDGYTKEN